MSLQVKLDLQRGEFHLDLDLSLDSGMTALYGPSGSGKTTLLHALAGLITANSPAVRVSGRFQLGQRTLFDSARGICLPPSCRRVGVVFQDLRLFPHRSVIDNLLFGYRLVADARRRLAPEQVIEVFEIGGLLHRSVDEISGGERQRVALGRAILAMPELLLMDEPLAAVDLQLRQQILPYLRWVQETLEIPILYVSHALPEILELTRQIVVLDRGRVVGSGEVFDVLGRTLHGALSEPFSTEATLPVTVENSLDDGSATLARIGDQPVVLPFKALSPGHRARVALGPEDVMLAMGQLEQVSARNQLRGEVVRISPLHGRHLIHVSLGQDATVLAELTQNAIAELGIEVGSKVNCVIKTSAFRWVVRTVPGQETT